MAEKIIAPLPPHDGREWEPQCARCGSSCDTYDREDDDEPVQYRCLSSAGWCLDHPRPGCDDVSRGEIEWYTFDPAPANRG